MIRPQDSLAIATHPKQPEQRALAVILAIAAVAGLGYAAVSKQWMYNDATMVGGAYGFGPRGMFRCADAAQATCESLTNGDFIRAWRQEIADANLVATMTSVIDLSLLSEPILPAELHRDGRTLAVEIGGHPATFDLDATTPDGQLGLYVATAKQLMTDKVTELSIDAVVAERVEHARTAIGGVLRIPREEVIGDAQTKAKSIAAQNLTSGAFAICGWIAFASCLLAGVSLALALALVVLRRRPQLPIMPTTTAILGIMVAIVSGCVFVATKPGASGFVGISFGFWGYAAGIILGIVSTLMLNRFLRPEDDELAEAMNADDF